VLPRYGLYSTYTIIFGGIFANFGVSARFWAKKAKLGEKVNAVAGPKLENRE